MQQYQPYVGAENLETMREARNYNRYLLGTVRKYARRSGRVLDFGAGNGEFAIPLRALGFDVTAVEPDDSLRSRLFHEGVGAAAGPDELPDRCFEYVYTLNVLEHIEDDVHALRQLHSKLTDTGTLLIYVPAFPVLYTAMDTNVGHVRRYTRSALIEKVTSAGLVVEYVSYVDSLGFLATLFFKYFGNDRGEINRRMLTLYDRVVFPLSRVLDTVSGRWYGKNLLLIARKCP